MVLFVGSIFNRRRLPETIAAFAAATARRPEARLVIVGADDRIHRCTSTRSRRPAGVGDRVDVQRYVSDAELDSLYQRASVFVFLSDYEGFGLTPLEALSAGVPIVVKDTPVAREVYGDAAWYVDHADLVGGATRAIATPPRRSDRRRHAAVPGPCDSRAIFLGHRRSAHAGGPGSRGQPVVTLSIIIVSFNARADLERCLRSLADAPPRLDHEIIVVDNGSSDGSVEAARGLPECSHDRAVTQRRVCRRQQRRDSREPRQAAPAPQQRHRGAGRGDRSVGRAGCEGTPDARVAGPRLVDPEGRVELSFGPMISPLNELRQKAVVVLADRGWTPARRRIERLAAQERFVDWVSGACLLVHRADAEAVGLLDERFFLYTEDVDFCAAIRARGGRILFTPVSADRPRAWAIAGVGARRGARCLSPEPRGVLRKASSCDGCRCFVLYLRLKGEAPPQRPPASTSW